VHRRFTAFLPIVAALFVVYVAAGKLGLKLAFVNASATAVWPPTGIALAAFLLLGYRVWPAILLGAFVVNITTAGSLATSIGIAVGNTLEGLLGAYFVNRFARGPDAFERPQDIFKFAFFAGVVSTTVGATIGVTTLELFGYASWMKYEPIWLTWWLGDAAGALILAPLLVLWVRGPRLHWKPFQYAEAAALLVAVCFFGFGVFGDWSVFGIRNYPLEFTCIPLVVWAAFRFERLEAATVSFLLSAIAIWGTLRGFGPFVRHSRNDSLLLLQAFLCVIAVMGVSLAAIIAERKLAEQALRTREEQLRLFVEHSPAAIAMFDHEMRYLVASRRWLEAYHLGDSGVIGHSHYEVLPDLPERWKSIHQRCLAGAVEKCEEDPFPRSDGTLDWVRWEIHPWRNARGAIGGIIICSELITDRKLAREQLAGSLERLDLAQKAGRIGTFEWDLETGGMVWSAEAEALYGLPPGAFAGQYQNWASTLHPEDRAQAERAMLHCVETRADLDAQFRILPPDGSIRWIAARGRIFRDPSGRALKMIGVNMDITALKHAEESLLQAQKMEAIGRLAGGVAHDFNNLLTAITGYNEMLLDQVRDRPSLREYAEEIQNAADRATSLTNQLLAFSRRQVIQPKVLSLNHVVQGTNKMLCRVIGEDIELSVRLDPTLWMVKADSVHLGQVLMNLAVNARDAMPAGGKLLIETANRELREDHPDCRDGLAPGRYVELSIVDSGTGMDAATRSHLFEPFFTTKDAGKGTGLGLSIVYGIVKQNGGTILLDSEPGRGTSIRIYLPAVEDQIEPAPVAAEAAATAGTETILLVEDEEAVRNLAMAMLVTRGYHVIDAPTPAEAIRIAGEYHGPIHMLLTDVIMPGMRGTELARVLTASRPEIAVLFMSGYSDGSFLNSANLGLAGYLAKPFTAAALLTKIREVLATKNA